MAKRVSFFLCICLLQPFTALSSPNNKYKKDFTKAELKRQAYIKIHFVGHTRKDKKIFKWLVRKGKELGKLYTNAAKHSSVYWKLAAEYRKSEIYYIFSYKIGKVPLPRNIPQKYHPMYKNIMANVSIEWEKIAIKSYRNVLTKAKQYKHYSHWICLAESDIWLLRGKLDCMQKKNRIKHPKSCGPITQTCIAAPTLAWCKKRDKIIALNCMRK